MKFHVLPKGVLPAERLATFLAQPRLPGEQGVPSLDVVIKKVLVEEACSASFTHERLGAVMHGHVDLETAQVHKALPTVGADAGHDLAMALQVDLQADLPLETLATFMTVIPLNVFLRAFRLGGVVGDHVLRHRGTPAKRLSTFWATVRAIVCVLALVQHKRRFEQKRHVAFVTLKRFQSRVPQSVYA